MVMKVVGAAVETNTVVFEVLGCSEVNVKGIKGVV